MSSNYSDMLFYTSGGRIPVGLLRELAEAGMVHGTGTIALGNRQEVILRGIAAVARPHIRHMAGTRLGLHHPRHPNIVTTRVACALTEHTPWLGEGSYDRVLQLFQSPPGLAVDLVDPRQRCAALFTGSVHFVATSEPDYWTLYLNDSFRRDRISLTSGIHSDDVATVAMLVQQAVIGTSRTDFPAIQQALDTNLGGRLKNLDGLPHAYPAQTEPIVGFVVDERSDHLSLGIPLQSSDLPGPFLVDLALLADRFDMANAYITTWKSLVVHGIPRSERTAFEKLLVRHRINLCTGRWDQVCLNNWRSEGLERCAKGLLDSLNHQVPHTGTLSMALVCGDAAFPDAPIIVRADTAHPSRSLFRRRPRFSLYARENFERYNPSLVCYGQGISAGGLVEHLVALVRSYSASEVVSQVQPARRKPRANLRNAFACPACGTEYSELYGDPMASIAAGTPFEDLPESWSCPTCAEPLNSFAPVAMGAA